jgi:single-stranded-DNA-specific exonuclease
MLIARSGAFLSYKVIVNLKVIEDGVFKDIDEVILKYSKENPIIITFDILDHEIYDFKKTSTIFEINSFISSNLDDFRNIKYKSISSACEFLGIKEKYFTSSIDLLERIFITVQMRASVKIYDFLNYCLEFAAIGTIADVMPLIDENRIFAKLGLVRMSNSSHDGISNLTKSKVVDSKFISWELSPILNSPGRFGKTDLTVDFFLEDESSIERDILSELRVLNDERKKLISDTCAELISDQSGKRLIIFNSMICAKAEKIPDGMTGLVASKLSDYYGKPSIVISIPGDNGLCRGSGRCNGSYDFFSMAEKVSEKFTRFGGHSQAFGFTIIFDKIDEMVNELAFLINHDDYSDYNSRIIVDGELKLIDINSDFISSLKILEPFGKGNEEPVFLTKNIKPDSFSRFGKTRDHGKLIFNNKTNLTAIGWGMADNIEELYKSGAVLDIVYRLENNEYNSKIYPRMILIGIKTSP